MSKYRGEYAELHAHSAYTFLEGTDLPRSLIKNAEKIGLSGIAILDCDGMYSAVQTSIAAKNTSVATVFGTELTLAYTDHMPSGWGLPTGSIDSGLRLPVLAKGQTGYHRLCQAISSHNLSSPGRRTGQWHIEDLAGWAQDSWMVLTGTNHGPLRRALAAEGMSGARYMRDHLVDVFGADNVAIESTLRPDSPCELAENLYKLAREKNLRLIATGAPRCANVRRQALADVMTASRLNLELSAARPHLPPFGSFLRGPEEMLYIHRHFPQAVAAAADLAAELSFDLKLIEPKLPHSDVPKGHTDASWLRHLTYQGAQKRYAHKNPRRDPWKVIEHELEIIEKLDFPGYFLIVKDIVDFCAREGILAQGRGSAANSAVCYALGITAVDAVEHQLMFERFLSEARRNPPDIDIDIEAGERERVIQYVYGKYGRDRAAQVANTITYRPRSAVRAAGKALGYGDEIVAQWSKDMSRGGQGDKQVPPLVHQVSTALQKLPRHMGIHPGGMVLTRSPVSQVCPIVWGAKEKRSVLQWDKEDCAEAGLVKFDLLGLGMLTALRKAFTALTERGVRGTDGEGLGLYNLTSEDSRVYDLLCAAETVGVFQVESRAQMSTLPRLKPRVFYDLVVEVALIRPGPIQGQAVNPYLERRNEKQKITCHPKLRNALERTLGVPIFQEQLMQIAVDVGGFTPTEADELRRAIASKHSTERLEKIRPRFDDGMKKNKIPQHLREQLYASLQGFAEFGFPESHAFSFAFLVYASAWLKVFYPEHFYAALLSSQPMGFYSPASLIADAKRHGVRVLPPSVVHSSLETCVEGDGILECDFPAGALMRVHKDLAIRLGLDTVKGLTGTAREKITRARGNSSFESMEDFARRSALSAKELEILSKAGAMADLGIGRREALWMSSRLANPHEYQPFLPGTEIGAETPELPRMNRVEELKSDWETLGLTTGGHPMSLQRETLQKNGVLTIHQATYALVDRNIKVAGLVTHRQRPGTAKGVTFLSLEDETGLLNVVCSVGLWKHFRRVALTSLALVVTGKVERRNDAYTLKAHKLECLPIPVIPRSRDFR